MNKKFCTIANTTSVRSMYRKISMTDNVKNEASRKKCKIIPIALHDATSSIAILEAAAENTM